MSEYSRAGIIDYRIFDFIFKGRIRRKHLKMIFPDSALQRMLKLNLMPDHYFPGVPAVS